MAATKKNLTLALDPSLMADLKAAADGDGISQSRYVENLVQADLARRAMRTLNTVRPLSLGHLDDLRQAGDTDREQRAA
jgi:hypothetical protein